MRDSVANESAGRRDFFKWAVTAFMGGVAVVTPAAATLAVLFDPLLRSHQQRQGSFYYVASLDALLDDGVPLKFSITADRRDAWSRYPNVPIGTVYLRRTGPKTVTAFNAICPHAGGFVDYLDRSRCFVCPLHNSQFALDGSIQDPKSPSPRPLDSLEVELRGNEIWVRFEDFRAGVREKIPA